MITGLHHYALAVPGLDVADDFLRGFGLETAAEDGGLVARCRLRLPPLRHRLPDPRPLRIRQGVAAERSA